MIHVTSIDASGLDRLRKGIQNALIGVGRDGDAAKTTEDQTRLLSMEIANQLNPKSQKKGDKNSARDVKGFLTDKPSEQNLNQNGKLHWLSVGPTFLLGIEHKNYRLDADAATALKLMRSLKSVNQNESKRGFVPIGQRGHQKVYKLNRVLVSSDALAGAIKLVAEATGKMKATFAQTGAALGEKRIPKWVSRHFGKQNDRVISKLGNIKGEKPVAEFGSRAPGITKQLPMKLIVKAVEVRKRKMALNLKAILSGYADDVRRRKPVTKKAKRTEA